MGLGDEVPDHDRGHEKEANRSGLDHDGGHCSAGMPARVTPPGSGQATGRPNVVFILCDDLRWDAWATPATQVKTPHIDRLAEEGVRFNNAFCTTSLCSPSRASILSGLYAHRHGVPNNFTDYPTTLDTFPEALQRRLRDGVHRQVAHGRGQRRAAARGSTTSSRTRARASTSTPSSTSTASGARSIGLLHARRHGHGARLAEARAPAEAVAADARPKAPHSFYLPEPKYEHAFDDVKIDYPATAFTLDDKPDWFKDAATPGTASTARCSNVARNSPTAARGGEGLRRHDPRLLGDDAVGR